MTRLLEILRSLIFGDIRRLRILRADFCQQGAVCDTVAYDS
jgi:hypothetical protein